MRTGNAAFSHVHGEAYYDWLAGHPEDSRRFDRSVRSQNRLVLRGLLTSYDWASCGTVIDVGGGDGTFLAGLLRRYKHLHGVVFDLPHVAAAAPEVLRDADVADRCSVLTGSFFEAVPRGGDVYLLKTILHDWDDEHASTLLRTVRQAMPPGGRLLVMEAILRPGDAYNVGKLMDLHSLVLVQGRDRDRDAFQALLTGAGLRLTNVTETETLAIIESVPL
ncbi:MAG: methyltransferase [Streptosporangiaceae bacterium]